MSVSKDTNLMEAAKNGDLEEVKRLLRKGVDLNSASSDGFTPLYNASQNGHVGIVKLLIKAGADVNTASSLGATPLFISSMQGHINIVKLLLEAGADVNAAARDGITSSNGVTPLYMASQQGHIDIVRQLLEARADVNAAQTNGANPLSITSEKGHIEIIKLLLEAGADVNAAASNGLTPVYMASLHGHIDVVKSLIKAGADVNAAKANGVTPLYMASQQGHINIVKLLIKAGADVNAARHDSTTPMLIASRQGHMDIMALLTEAGADKRSYGRFPNYYSELHGVAKKEVGLNLRRNIFQKVLAFLVKLKPKKLATKKYPPRVAAGQPKRYALRVVPKDSGSAAGESESLYEEANRTWITNSLDEAERQRNSLREDFGDECDYIITIYPSGPDIVGNCSHCGTVISRGAPLPRIKQRDSLDPATVGRPCDECGVICCIPCYKKSKNKCPSCESEITFWHGRRSC